MNTSNLILILLQNKNLSSKSKFFSIIEIVSSWLIEKYFFVSQEKAEQQITSEILYLFEKYEKSKLPKHGSPRGLISSRKIYSSIKLLSPVPLLKWGLTS